MENVKEFKSQVIWIDEQEVKRDLCRFGGSISEMDSAISSTEAILGETLSLKDKKKLAVEGFEFVMKRLRERFPFKEGTDQINLQAIGVDPNGLRGPLDKLVASYAGGNYRLTGQGFEVDETLIRDIHTIETSTENQNRALWKLKKYCDFLNENVDEIMEIGKHRSKSILNQGISESFGFMTVRGHGEQSYLAPHPSEVFGMAKSIPETSSERA